MLIYPTIEYIFIVLLRSLRQVTQLRSSQRQGYLGHSLAASSIIDTPSVCGLPSVADIERHHFPIQ